MPKLSNDEWNNLIYDYENGLTYKKISNKYNICETTLYRKLKKINKIGNSNKKHKYQQKLKKINDDDELKIIELYKNGQTYDFILNHIGKFSSEGTIYRVLNKHNVLRKFRSKPTENPVNHDYFDVIGPKQSYWLGLLMADGYVHEKRGYIELSLMQEDMYLVDMFANELGSTRKKNINKNKYGIKISSRKIISKLHEFGIIQRKTGLEYIPDIEDKLNFIRGFFDGDGSVGISKQHKWFRISSASKTIIEQIRDYFKSFGISHKEISTHKNMSSIHYSSYNDCIILSRILYIDNNNIFMKRKKDKAREIYKKCLQKLNQ